MPQPYTVPLSEARSAFLAELDGFHATVSTLDDHALLGPSHAYGWSRLDCVIHVRMGLQELLAGTSARTDVAPDVDAASYWSTWEADADEDVVPGILMTRRTACAYTRPTHAYEHLHQVVMGLRQTVPTMPDAPVQFQGHAITAGDLLATWAVELVVHHHDVNAPRGPAALSPAALAIGRRTVQALRNNSIDGGDDLSVLLAGFGRA